SNRDLGGTIAYMAPERLRALASNRASVASSGSFTRPDQTKGVIGSDSTGNDRALDIDAHQADVYSLGMVLLEAVIGRNTAKGVIGVPAPDHRSDSLSAAVAARSRSAEQLIRAAEAASGRRIPAGLRAILEHALEPDPATRYLRARDLAEDLDRWRSARSLAF